MIFEEALQINYHHQDYHQLERGGFDAKCREHDLVHKEKHQDAGGDGDGDGDDGDGDDHGECGETKQHVLLLIITGLVKTAFI